MPEGHFASDSSKSRPVRDAPGAAARPLPRRTAPAFASRVQASPRRLAAATIRTRAPRRRGQCAPLRQPPVGTAACRPPREFRTFPEIYEGSNSWCRYRRPARDPDRQSREIDEPQNVEPTNRALSLIKLIKLFFVNAYDLIDLIKAYLRYLLKSSTPRRNPEYELLSRGLVVCYSRKIFSLWWKFQ